jgi:hypothetical protein
VPIARSAQHRIVVCALLVLGALGCGQRGLSRYPLEGTVTFEGTPVPGGQVILEPDFAKGNRGPGAYCDITDGRFQTPPGKGHVGGPYRVRIMGFEYSTDPATGDRVGRELFPPFDLHLDLPRAVSVQEISVPAPASQQGPRRRRTGHAG